MKIDGIIFDLDGTLWDAMKPIYQSWKLVLERYPKVKHSVTEQSLMSCMGQPMTVFAERLFEKSDYEIGLKILMECCDEEEKYLRVHGGTLYPMLEETLASMVKKYKLYIVSNCQKGYIECFLDAHKLGRYFSDTNCWGNTGLTKGETNLVLMKQNNLRSPIYVGDTQGDCNSAKVAGIEFVYAKYGFGQVQDYKYSIDKFEDIIKLVEEIENK